MAKYTFSKITESEYLPLLKKASYTTFYNSPERIKFISKRNRKTNLYKINDENGTVAVAFYQVIPARSGVFVYFQHSPIFIDTRTANDPTFWQEMISFSEDIGRQENAVYVRLTPRFPSNQEIISEQYQSGYKKAPVQELDACVTRVINVQDYTEDSLVKDHQELLVRAQNKQLQTFFNTTTEALEDFSSIYRTLSAKKQIDFVPLDYLREELQEYLEHKELIIAEVKDTQGTLYSAACIIVQGDNAWYYWVATTEQGKEIGAEVQILHETIKYLQKQDIKKLDLWGGSVSKEVTEKGLPHPWKAQDSFRKGFGASLVEYLPAVDIPIKKPQYLAAVFYQRALMTKRGYPYIPLK